MALSVTIKDEAKYAAADRMAGGTSLLQAKYAVFVDSAATPVRTQWSWAGVELPCVEGGVDFALSDWIAVGPWASLTFARFTSDSAKPEGSDEVSGAVRGRTVHRWTSAGLQATLKL